MSDFIFSETGRVQGFRIGAYIHDMGGRAIGRVSAERVYRLDGSYVGEVLRNMVVEKPVGARRNLPPVDYPGDAAIPALDSSRGGGSFGFPDVFHRLLEPEPGSSALAGHPVHPLPIRPETDAGQAPADQLPASITASP
jgi:hypothetical protein